MLANKTLPFDPATPRHRDHFETEMRIVLDTLIHMSHEMLDEMEREAIDERDNPAPTRKGPKKPSQFMAAYLRLQREIRAQYRFLREYNKDLQSNEPSEKTNTPASNSTSHKQKGASTSLLLQQASTGPTPTTSTAKQESKPTPVGPRHTPPAPNATEPRIADRVREGRVPSRPVSHQETRPASAPTTPTGVNPAKPVPVKTGSGTSKCDQAKPQNVDNAPHTVIPPQAGISHSEDKPEPRSAKPATPKPKPAQTPALPAVTKSGVPLYYPEGYRPKHPSDTNRREFLRAPVHDPSTRPPFPFNKPKSRPGLDFL